MTAKSPSSRYSRFRFDAGSPALNFVATVRHRGSTPRDLLASPEALVRWFRLAGFPVLVFSVSSIEFEEALSLREAIYRIFLAVIQNAPPAAADLERLNTHASHSPPQPEIDTTSLTVSWQCDRPTGAFLAEIARDTLTVLAGRGNTRLKMCDNGTCRMLFLDLSPPNRRRWCAMSICGNREKARLHRRRKKDRQGETKTMDSP